MTKITADQLSRDAFVYIRQSTADQLLNNPESRRRQYGLADRARQLGWTKVEVIDDDLGRSGGGINRPGFERLLAAICEGRVGAVFAIEASRLARNGRDWHTLIEFCGLVGTVIVDEDGIYDPRHPNDRLLLGMKGTMSELELSLFRQRSQEALKQKARRGELFLGVAAGYVRVGRDRIEKDPDQRVQDAIRLVFAKFAETKRATGARMAARRGHCIARRAPPRGGGPQHRLETAAVQHRPQHPDEPDLRRGVCLWTHDEQGVPREWPQARQARPAAPIGRVGRAA
jgi:DNA invertase Pin-like site-specific DNA recombinase